MEKDILVSIKLKGREEDINYVMKDLYKISEHEEVTAMHIQEYKRNQ